MMTAGIGLQLVEFAGGKSVYTKSGRSSNFIESKSNKFYQS